MKDNQDVVVINEGVKKTGRGGKYNFPNAIEPEDPAVVREAASSALYWMKRGRDNKPQSDDEIQERIDEFLVTCYETGQRATVEKLALALGTTRKTLSDWELGHTQSARRSDLIKSAKEYLAAFDADLVTAGKMNPVPYIFRAKNYFGMRDQTDIIVEPKSTLDSTISAEEVAAKYKELPED